MELPNGPITYTGYLNERSQRHGPGMFDPYYRIIDNTASRKDGAGE